MLSIVISTSKNTICSLLNPFLELSLGSNDLKLEIDNSLPSSLSTSDLQGSFSMHLREQHLLMLQESHSLPSPNTPLNVKKFP